MLVSCDMSDAHGTSGLIGKTDAQNIAFENLGVNAEKISYSVVTPETFKGEEYYVVEAQIDGVKYSFRIDRASGEVKKIFVNDESVSSLPVIIDSEAKTDGYIGYEGALAVVLADLGINGDEAEFLGHELDFSHGKYYYEIKLAYNGVSYEYDIDAADGSIFKKDVDKYTVKEPSVEGEEYIGLESAYEKLLAHIGETKETVTLISGEWDREKGVSVYEFELLKGTDKLKYTVNAVSGDLIHTGESTDNNSSAGQSGGNTAQDVAISAADAKGIALAHAGLSSVEGIITECELEKEHGIFVYEIDFDYNGYEYEYLVSASTGEIIEADKEKDD